MIVTTTKRRAGDTRLFCAEWHAVPMSKFKPSMIKINEFAYPEHEIPEDFYKKHAIYYVDQNDRNRLLKAYELEDEWENISFLDTIDVVAINGDISDDVYVQYLARTVADCTSRLENLVQFVNDHDLDGMEFRLQQLEHGAVMDRDVVNIEQEDK